MPSQPALKISLTGTIAMKKQLSLIAVAGAAIVLSSAPSFAQAAAPTPVPALPQKFDATKSVTTTLGFHSTQTKAIDATTSTNEAWTRQADLKKADDPNTFTASGTIEKYIKFKSVDSALELGDIGTPTFVGETYSAAISVPVNTELGETKGNSVVTLPTNPALKANGLASVTFDANTYVQVQATGDNTLLNVGADDKATTGAAAEGDDFRLPVAYALSAKGKYLTQIPAGDPKVPVKGEVNAKNAHNAFTDSVVANNDATKEFSGFSGFVSAPGTGGALGVAGTNTERASGLHNIVVTFEPNGGAALDPNKGSNGFQIAAKVTRNGLNDYHGNYSGTVSLNYWQW